MTLENALLAALSAVVTGLCYLFTILWKRSEDCEKDRRELRAEIESVKTNDGVNRGRLDMVSNCPKRDCPFEGIDFKNPLTH